MDTQEEKPRQSVAHAQPCYSSLPTAFPVRPRPWPCPIGGVSVPEKRRGKNILQEEEGSQLTGGSRKVVKSCLLEDLSAGITSPSNA